MHTSWLPEKHATARSARGRDKVQTCYSHQGNNDTRISTWRIFMEEKSSIILDIMNHLIISKKLDPLADGTIEMVLPKVVELKNAH